MNSCRYLGYWLLIILGVAWNQVLAEDGEDPVVSNVYKNDFTKAITFDQWSHTETSRTPGGGRILNLNQQTEFKMGDLPKHEFIRMRLSLAVLGSQDGSDPKHGPDQFSIVIHDGTTVMRTTFRNPPPNDPGLAEGLGQAYPDDTSGAAPHASGTGAKIKGGALGDPLGSMYEIELAFPHRQKGLGIEFFYSVHQPHGEESFGLQSMEIDVVSGAVPRTEADLDLLWGLLSGKDPVEASQAVTELIASGEAGAEFVRKKSVQRGDEAKGVRIVQERKLVVEIEKWTGALESEDFKERVAARSALKKMPLEALPLLEKRMSQKRSKAVRVALASVVKAMQARANKEGVEDHQLRVQSRVAKVLRVWDIAKSGRKITSSSGWAPLGSLDDNYAPLKSQFGSEVPRFFWSGSAKAGPTDWVQYEFPDARTFESAEVIWVVNRFWEEGAKLPASWSLNYLDGEAWKPVRAKGEYTVTEGALDRIEFEPVTTKSMRIVVVRQGKAPAGMFEFRLGESKIEAGE